MQIFINTKNKNRPSSLHIYLDLFISAYYKSLFNVFDSNKLTGTKLFINTKIIFLSIKKTRADSPY